MLKVHSLQAANIDGQYPFNSAGFRDSRGYLIQWGWSYSSIDFTDRLARTHKLAPSLAQLLCEIDPINFHRLRQGLHSLITPVKWCLYLGQRYSRPVFVSVATSYIWSSVAGLIPVFLQVRVFWSVYTHQTALTVIYPQIDSLSLVFSNPISTVRFGPAPCRIILRRPSHVQVIRLSLLGGEISPSPSRSTTVLPVPGSTSITVD